MDIFVVGTENSRELVSKIKADFPMHSINSTLIGDIDMNKGFLLYFEEQVKIADIILVLVNKDFLENKIFLEVLSTTETKGTYFIVQIDKAPLPAFFNGMRTIEFDTQKSQGFSEIKKQIKKLSIEKNKSYISITPYLISGIKYVSLTLFAIGWLGCILCVILGSLEPSALDKDILEDFKQIAFSASISGGLIYVILRIFETNDNAKEIEEARLYQKKLNQIIRTQNNGMDIAQIVDTECGGPEDDTKNNIGEFQLQQSIDVLRLMVINLENINKFYHWSQKQAKSSFVFAIVMCVAGFLLIASAIVLSFLLKISDTALIISVVGGAITELISATSLLVYRTSLKQLNYYHKALHEDERFLSSINLIDKFKSPKNYDEMLKEIIRSEIQLNILETKQKSDGKYTVKLKNKSK